jgi:hypothetical protein
VDELERANKAQWSPEEVKGGTEIGRFLQEGRTLCLAAGNGETHEFFGNMRGEHSLEILNKVEDAERVQALGGEQVLLSPR